MFIDRKDAAQQLALALQQYRDQNAVVLGIPRGGAVTAFFVARYLHAAFSLLIARKLGHPLNPEFAVGAVAEDGNLYLNPFTLYELSPKQLDEAVAEQKEEIARRIQVLRQGEPLPDLKNRIVILADDGIATGATLMAAIKMCKKQGAARIVVGAPVSSQTMINELRQEVDEVVVLESPEDYHAVSQVYLSFPQVTDSEAGGLMALWKKENRSAKTGPSSPPVIDEP